MLAGFPSQPRNNAGVGMTEREQPDRMELLKPIEAARYLGISPSSLARLNVPGIRISSRTWRYRIARLDEWAANHRRTARKPRRPRSVVGTSCATDREILASAVMLYRPAVYGLVDPREPDRVRYVGQAVAPLIRYAGHLTAGSIRVSNWVGALDAAGESPVMVLLEACAEADLVAREGHWLAHFRALDQADLNVAPAPTRRFV